MCDHPHVDLKDDRQDDGNGGWFDLFDCRKCKSTLTAHSLTVTTIVHDAGRRYSGIFPMWKGLNANYQSAGVCHA